MVASESVPTSRQTPAHSTPSHVRIGPISALPSILVELGVPPQPVFEKAGVELRTFGNPDTRIAFESLGRLLVESVAASGREDVALLTGARFALEDLGALGHLMRHSATVADALQALLLHLNLFDRGAVPLLLELEPANVLLGYSVHCHGVPGVAHVYDGAVAISFRLLSELCGPQWRPSRVQFSHQQPRDAGPYRQLFGTPVEFNADVSGIAFASAWLRQPIAGASPERRKVVAADLQQCWNQGDLNFTDQVRAALPQLILSGSASAGAVADLYGIHERTLRKRLGASKEPFRHLIGQARFELAQQLLENTHLPMAQLALALHYATPAVFSRAFRAWSNMSPTDWRARSHISANSGGIPASTGHQSLSNQK